MKIFSRPFGTLTVLTSLACVLALSGCDLISGNGPIHTNSLSSAAESGASTAQKIDTATYSWIQKNIFAPQCLACHNGTVSSSTASGSNSFDTYADAVQFLIPGDPENSILYQQVSTGQMPQSGPALSAAETQAIYTWIQNGALDDVPATPTPAPPPTAVPTATPTATAMPTPTPAPAGITFTQITTDILSPRCLGCHTAGQQPGGNVALDTYAGVMATVTAGNATGSELYQSISSGLMPTSGAKISASLLTELQTWINQGAPDN